MLPAVLCFSCGVPAPHAYVSEPLQGAWTVAVLPLANYSGDRDAPDRVAPILAVEIARHRHVRIVDAGKVEEVLAEEPWMLADRIPPDLVDRFGEEMEANALLVGSILAHGYREEDGNRIPVVSLSLRLLETPGGKVLWSANHSRDGADGESIFGLGRVMNLEQLVEETVGEIVDTMPPVVFSEGTIIRRKAG